MSLWLPLDGPVRVRRNVAPVTGGVHVSGAVIKLLSHTTEGLSFHPDPRRYYGHTGWPHVTNDVDGTLWQHIDLDIAARALKNVAGGVQTNRGGPVQVENVGFSPLARRMTLTAAQVTSFRWLAQFLHDHRGLDLTAHPPWTTAGSARATAPQRIPASEWYRTGGIIAHALAPENDHWDSGGIPLAEFLPVSTPAVEEDDHMIPYDTPHPDARGVRKLVNHFFTVTGDGGPPHTGWLPDRDVIDDQAARALDEALHRLILPEFWGGRVPVDLPAEEVNAAWIRANGVGLAITTALGVGIAIGVSRGTGRAA